MWLTSVFVDVMQAKDTDELLARLWLWDIQLMRAMACNFCLLSPSQGPSCWSKVLGITTMLFASQRHGFITGTTVCEWSVAKTVLIIVVSSVLLIFGAATHLCVVAVNIERIV